MLMLMCTVVLRHGSGGVRALALRDELVGRAFDDPGPWWPGQPTVVGGHDRAAGGSWCVTDVASGATAFVLNRPQRRAAEAGAPSRGVLPLLAVQHGEGWVDHVELSGMASFALVLAPSLWVWDGTRLTCEQLPAGVSMVTSGGAEDGKAHRHLEAFQSCDDWPGLVQGVQPAADPTALLVRHEVDDRVFGTVFGQLITAAPGRLSIASSRAPWEPGWPTTGWRSTPDGGGVEGWTPSS